MNILLVYPKFPDTFWSFKHVLNYISKRSALPPLGLITIGSMLQKGWNKKLIDLNVNKLEEEDIVWADFVFISAMIVQKESVNEIVRRCKLQGKKIIAGGPAFTTQHDSYEGVDYFILNEAEVTLPIFLNDLEEGNPKPIYTSELRPDVTKTPVPDWSLIDFNDYASMSLQYSRGCPFNCEFCDIIIMNGRVPRSKTAEQMINELQSLYDFGWKGPVFIVDDNFIGNKTKVKAILPELIKWQKENGYPFLFSTEASVNIADDEELMQMMSAANFYKLFLGIETPSIDGLKECGKVQNISKNLPEVVKTIHEHGMQVMGGFIVGFDSDTENIFETQIRFIQQIGVVNAMVGMLGALPKTRLWYRLKDEGRLLNDTTGENTDGTLNFVPNMGKEKLINGYKKVVSTIYSHKLYYQRINTFIKQYKPTVRDHISFQNIIAFIKSTWKIGILSKARVFYWKLLIKTGFTKTKALPIAIELAIFGQHFEKITKRIVAV